MIKMASLIVNPHQKGRETAQALPRGIGCGSAGGPEEAEVRDFSRRGWHGWHRANGAMPIPAFP